MGQSCYWTVPAGKLWPDQQLACQSGGGNLAALRDVNQYERARKVIQPLGYVER